MANLTYSVHINTITISLDKTFTYNVLKKRWRNRKNINFHITPLVYLSCHIFYTFNIFRNGKFHGIAIWFQTDFKPLFYDEEITENFK